MQRKAFCRLILLLMMKPHNDINFPWYHVEDHAKKTIGQARTKYSTMLEYEQHHTTSNTLNILWTPSVHQARRLLV